MVNGRGTSLERNPYALLFPIQLMITFNSINSAFILRLFSEFESFFAMPATLLALGCHRSSLGVRSLGALLRFLLLRRSTGCTARRCPAMYITALTSYCTSNLEVYFWTAYSLKLCF